MQAATQAPSTLAGLQDWQAAIVGYFIAILMAGTEAAPLAVAGSWGIAIFMLLDQASGGQTLGTLISSVQGAAAQPSQAAQAAQGQANAAQSIFFASGSPNIVQPQTTSATNNVTGYVP